MLIGDAEGPDEGKLRWASWSTLVRGSTSRGSMLQAGVGELFSLSGIFPAVRAFLALGMGR